MFVIPTKSRFKNQTTPDAPRAISRAGKSKSELMELGRRMGWDSTRELSVAYLRDCSATEYEFHEALNPNFAGAFERASNKEADTRNQRYWDVRKKWTGQTPISDDERQRMKDVAQQFERLYPQYIKSEANSKVLWFHLRETNADPTKLADVIRAYEGLAMAGTIALNPSAISAGPESCISGTQLTTHRHFHLLLQSHRRPTTEESMSSKEFYEQHQELHPGAPYLIRVRDQQLADTQKAKKLAEQATVRAGSTSITDYGQKQHGVPPQPDKTSFRIKLRSMSAAEILQRCNDDPAFKKALDELK
jgi:hypothetical protein